MARPPLLRQCQCRCQVLRRCRYQCQFPCQLPALQLPCQWFTSQWWSRSPLSNNRLSCSRCLSSSRSPSFNKCLSNTSQSQRRNQCSSRCTSQVTANAHLSVSGLVRRVSATRSAIQSAIHPGAKPVARDSTRADATWSAIRRIVLWYARSSNAPPPIAPCAKRLAANQCARCSVMEQHSLAAACAKRRNVSGNASSPRIVRSQAARWSASPRRIAWATLTGNYRP